MLKFTRQQRDRRMILATIYAFDLMGEADISLAAFQESVLEFQKAFPLGYTFAHNLLYSSDLIADLDALYFQGHIDRFRRLHDSYLPKEFIKATILGRGYGKDQYQKLDEHCKQILSQAVSLSIANHRARWQLYARAPMPIAPTEPAIEFGPLADHYQIENRPEVMSFIRKYPFLLSILQDSPNQIYRIFGKDVILFLDLHSDPQEGWDELFIVIKSAYSAEEAIRLENRLAKEWFLGKMEATQGKLNITEEPL